MSRAADPPGPVATAGVQAWPADGVEVGRVLGGWGVKGWLKVQPYAQDPQGLLNAPRWYLEPASGGVPGVGRQALTIVQSRCHGELVLAAAAQCNDRDAAEALRGARVYVSRQAFPPVASDEYYWVDLIGSTVVNREGQTLGTVGDMLDAGVHSVLCVAPVEAGAAERLIPFVSAYVDTVDVAARRIVVDWGLDY